ncbi:PrsW family glutamic-type intramembrane protease [Paraliomyxa miuraensis]|uniref:PrsW family glutamic-type intramembrane protease n=1 Tax=Paraliomyxa miuraensis TaxID=376150 RepID=UPI00225AB774|nr:PrsW family glutamic-type intramembrane protease [Paraliomyxa miuraensis]MCX4246875.1 PrsW family glutamic-type intramembrane protease [Paraliomyxa miuraensis]
MQSPPPAGMPTRPGWYPDPWNRNQWRWWDGWTWTTHVNARAKKPALPGWLSVPVIIASILVVPVVVIAAAMLPVVVALAMVPIAIVLPVMLWLDRVEPEPWAALVHAFLWGATVSVLVASICNATVGIIGGPVLASVTSAPLVEEAMKAGGILYAVRRREVDGPMDGIIYAGWTAVGFAVVENVEYLVQAQQEGQLAAVFVLRGLMGPFAHPLFTAWTGLAIGGAVAAGRPVFPRMLWGYALAVLSHALWNGSAAAPQLLGDMGVQLLGATVLAFVTVFTTFGIVLYVVRRKEERRFAQAVPWLAQQYGLAVNEVALFGDLGAMSKTRRRLTKDQRRWFDRMHAALARLAVLHARPGTPDPGTHQALAEQLQQARFGTGG